MSIYWDASGGQSHQKQPHPMIVLVDSDRVNSTMHMTYVSQEGLVTAEATDNETALSLLRALAPAVLVTVWWVPSIGHAIREARALLGQGTRVTIVTGYQGDETERAPWSVALQSDS